MYMHPQDALMVFRSRYESPAIYQDEQVRVEITGNNRVRAIRRRLTNRRIRRANK